MSQSKCFLNESPLLKYVQEKSLRWTKAQKGLHDATLNHPEKIMLGDPVVLQLTSNLIKLIRGKKVLDVGVYTGASALSAALAIPEDGKVYALDVTDDYITSIGRRFWQEDKIEHKINLFIAPALDTLQKFLDEGQGETFDFAFIDADKVNVINYYEYCLKLIRPGGVIAIDNTIWFNRVIDETNQEESTKTIRQLNTKLKDDQRINISYLTIGDGLSVCFKKW